MRVREQLAGLCLLVVVGLTACASGGSKGPGVPRGNANVITRDEIVAAHVSDAYEAVQKLRPEWFHNRGAMSVQSPDPAQTQPVVFLDGQNYGTLDDLRNIQAIDIQSMTLLSANDATTRFGTGYPGGVIMITTVK
jgi:glutaredoxin